MLPFIIIGSIIGALGLIGKAAKDKAMSMQANKGNLAVPNIGNNHRPQHRPSSASAPWDGQPVFTLRNPDTLPGVWPGLGATPASFGGGGSSSPVVNGGTTSTGASNPASAGASGKGGLSPNRLSLL